MRATTFRKTRTVHGRPTAICRLKTVQYVPLPLDEKREYHTIAGLLMEYLQRIPQQGEEVQVGDYMLKTLQIENHRVQKVQLIPLRDEDEMDFEV